MRPATARARGYVTVNPDKAIFPPLSGPVGPYPSPFSIFQRAAVFVSPFFGS